MDKEKEQNNISNKVFEKISDEKVCPKPRWEFVAKNTGIWVFGGVTVVLGSFAVAATLFVFKNIRFELYSATHENFITFTIEFLPYLWVVLLVLFISATHYSIRHTDQGYKYNLTMIIVSSVSLSLIFGSLLYLTGFGQIIDRDFGRHIPLHKTIESHNQKIWNNPERGLLSGRIIISTSSEIILKDSNDKDWILITSDLPGRGMEVLEKYEKVRVIGKDEENQMFYVCLVMPFGMENPEFMRGEREGFPLKEMRNILSERKFEEERNIKCKGVRPYQQLLER